MYKTKSKNLLNLKNNEEDVPLKKTKKQSQKVREKAIARQLKQTAIVKTYGIETSINKPK
jgi:hypothetical protein